MYTHRTGGQHPNPLTNFPDNKGWTPLHYACYDNNIKLVLQLIKAGADPNARYDLSFVGRLWTHSDPSFPGSTLKCCYTVKDLGYFNHIFRFSQLHQSDQGMLTK